MIILIHFNHTLDYSEMFAALIGQCSYVLLAYVNL